jgi:hypothetical protein
MKGGKRTIIDIRIVRKRFHYLLLSVNQSVILYYLYIMLCSYFLDNTFFRSHFNEQIL